MAFSSGDLEVEELQILPTECLASYQSEPFAGELSYLTSFHLLVNQP